MQGQIPNSFAPLPLLNTVGFPTFQTSLVGVLLVVFRVVETHSIKFEPTSLKPGFVISELALLVATDMHFFSLGLGAFGTQETSPQRPMISPMLRREVRLEFHLAALSRAFAAAGSATSDSCQELVIGAIGKPLMLGLLAAALRAHSFRCG